ncbi:MAG TPA: hypothetical protein VGC51_05785 [Hansschlegelia sp.]
MSDVYDVNEPEEPAPEMVEAFAKQLFRSENPPDLLWDTKIFESAGRSTEGLRVVDPAAKDEYLRRAHELLLDAARDQSAGSD